MDRQQRQWKKLAQITSAINSGLLLEDVLEQIYDNLSDVIPYNRIEFALLVNDGQTISTRWVRTDQPDVRVKVGHVRPLATSSLEAVVEDGHPRIINDLEAYLDDHPESKTTALVVEEGMRAALICPLYTNTTPIGLVFFTSTRPHVYTPDHLEMYEFMADQIAMMVERDRLISELGQQYENFYRTTRDLQVMNDIITEINSKQDLQTMLQTICDYIMELLGCSAAGIMLYRPDLDLLQAVAQSGVYDSTKYYDRIRKNQGVTGKVWSSGEPLIIEDYQSWAGRIPDHPNRDVRSVLCVPIHLDRSFIGVMTALMSYKNRVFGEEDLRRLTFLANHAASAIQKARLIESLEARNRDLNTFNHMVAHNLKSPLNGILGYNETLRDYYGDSLPADAHLLFDKITQASFKMSEIIDSLLMLAELGNRQIPRMKVDMAPIIKGVVTRYDDDLEKHGIEVVLQDTYPVVYGYAPWLEQAIANLISNAIKYIGKDNPQPRITIEASCRAGQVRYQIIDNGLGISPDELNGMFEMYTRLHPGEAPGHGLGLSIVKRIIESMDGTLGIDSKPGQGSTFWFEMPGERC